MNRITSKNRKPAARKRIIKALVDRVKGHTWSMEVLDKRSITREIRKTHRSPAETKLSNWLHDLGVDTTPQKAIGPYNCDLATDSVAVEIFGGKWHGYGDHLSRYPKRCNYILDKGWNLVIVWDHARYPLSIQAAHYIAAFIKESRGNPSMRGEYRVIRGNGEESSRGKFQFDNQALVIPRKRSSSGRS